MGTCGHHVDGDPPAVSNLHPAWSQIGKLGHTIKHQTLQFVISTGNSCAHSLCIRFSYPIAVTDGPVGVF